ncbi:MAG: GspE/PulE family protein [Phycisphaerae bacterium]|nr:GspE/PulE family protein [Phycisphaerae bacterium]
MPVELFDELRTQLLETGLLSAEQLDDAQQRAAREGCSLEETLVKMRLLLDSQVTVLKAARLGVPYCNLADYIANLQNAELIPEEVARRHVMFPLFVLDGIVTLVMADAGDLTGIDQVRRRTRQEVEQVLGSPSDIMALIERAYGAHKYLETAEAALSSGDGEEPSTDAAAQPVIRLVDNLISEATHQGASDIHIEPQDRQLRIRIRVDGVLREVAAPPLALHRAMVSRIKVLARIDIAQTRRPQDGAFHHRAGNREVVVRVSVLPSIYGEAVVLRLLRNESETVSLPDLGMEASVLERFRAQIQCAHGMILVSGPTGSGKSTTLYAALKEVASPERNVIAIEDPVEYRLPAIRQVQVNPEASLTFASGLRSILRQDPDVVMVGEIRDGETAQIAVQAALTGHLVFSTVHTNDSVSSVVRLRDMGVAPYLISSSLLAVVAQRLCRRICPDCVTDDQPAERHLRAIGLTPDRLDFRPQRGRGCRRCFGGGYLSRVGLYELFELSEENREQIVRGEPTEVIRATARSEGMKFLRDDGLLKLRAGLTTVEEVARVAGSA